MASDRVRVAVTGAGRMGRLRADAFSRNGRCVVTAAAAVATLRATALVGESLAGSRQGDWVR